MPELNEAARVEVLKIQTRGKPIDGVDLQEMRVLQRASAALVWKTFATKRLSGRSRSKREANSVRITREDFVRAMGTELGQDQRFNKLDSLLIESATQLAEPTGTARVRLSLFDGTTVKGDVIWADAAFLKIRNSNGDPDLVVAKRQIQPLEALPGTDAAALDELQIDRWAVRSSETV